MAVDDAMDQAKMCEIAIVTCYQTGGLINHARRLAELTAQSKDRGESDCFATAAILISAAALEAILSEFLFQTNLPAYSQKFRGAGVPHKYKMIWKRDLVGDYPEVSELWGIRNAIVHSEPDNKRSRTYGARINPAGAAWAHEPTRHFAISLWGPDMPRWLRSDLGLDDIPLPQPAVASTDSTPPAKPSGSG